VPVFDQGNEGLSIEKKFDASKTLCGTMRSQTHATSRRPKCCTGHRPMLRVVDLYAARVTDPCYESRT
jgi:hypothetical protein